MYALTKLSKLSLAYIHTLTSTGAHRTAAFTVAAAYSMARELALPPGQVDELDIYFRLQHEIALCHRLDTLNELAPIDIKAIKELARAFYQQRYAAANPVAIPLLLRCGKEVEDLFSLSKFFPSDFFDTLKEHGEAITRHISGLHTLQQDLNLAQVKDAEPWDLGERDHYAA